MPDEGARIRYRSGANRLVIQVQLARTSRPGDDEFRKGALTYLPSAVDHDDAGIRQSLSGHPLSVSRE
jgi:hypothetical protein